jgi:hypothetical protein
MPLSPLTREPRLVGDATDRCGGRTSQLAQPADAGASQCSDPDARDYQARGTATGTNGAFTDECDANGDITEYVCELQYTMVPGCIVPGGGGGVPPGAPPSSGPATPQCPSFPTGRVVGEKLTCFGGLCREGACGTYCPMTGDSVRYERVGADGSALLANTCDGGRYECTLLEDFPTAFDCIRSPTIGFTTTIGMAYFFGGPDNCTGLWPKSTVPTMMSPGSRHVQLQTRDRDAPGLQLACNYDCVIIE